MTDVELYADFDRLGIPYVLTHHVPVYTVAESEHHLGDLPGGHVKNLLLRNKKNRLWLFCALQETAVDLKALGEKMGSGRLSFANAEQLRATLGVETGAVSVLAIVNDEAGEVRVVLERRVAACERLNFHPLRNDATVTLATSDVLRFLEAHGHAPIEVQL
jgi:Ala-tRNA(Pro) deacylase